MYAHNSKYQRENPETGSFLYLHDLNDVVELLYSSAVERANMRRPMYLKPGKQAPTGI